MDDILIANNIYFDSMESQIYPSEFSLIKPIPLIQKPRFSIFISNDIVSTKINCKSDENFEIVNFRSLDGDVARSTSTGVYISQVIFQLIRFARASSHVADFNTRKKLLTQKLLKHSYQYHLNFIDDIMI